MVAAALMDMKMQLFWSNYGITIILSTLSCLTYGKSGRDAGLPEISYISEDQEVDPGTTAMLRCIVDNPSTDVFPVIWLKAGGAEHDLPLTTGSSVIVRDPKYQLQHTSNKYELRIQNTQSSDSGEYLCHVYLGIQNYISSRTRLQVRRPPVVIDESTSTESLVEGSAGKLECYAEGIPEPRITWLREDGGPLPSGEQQSNGNFLVIHDAQTKHQGVYLCMAENSLGRDIRKVNLTVEVKPKVVEPATLRSAPQPVMCTPRCKNGGQCVDTNNCRCKEGFAGSLCEKRRIECNPAEFSPLTILGVESSSGVECQEGSHWRKDCNWCRCVKGRPHCARRTCTREMNAEFVSVAECKGDSNWRDSCNWCSCCDSKAVCTNKRCQTAPHGDICVLPAIQPDTRRCGGFISMWTYNSMLERCQRVIYRGCGATANLFSTREECRQRCVLTAPHTSHL